MKHQRPRDPVVRVRREDDFSWGAGLFEGEGTVTIGVRRSDDTYRLICTIGMTDQQIIEWFADRWGGWLQLGHHQERRRPVWIWTVAGPRALAFVLDLEPYIRSDRVRAKFAVALAFRELQGAYQFGPRSAEHKAQQRALYEQMKKLNRRGVQEILDD